MSSVLIYNVEKNTNKEKLLNDKVCPNFWPVATLTKKKMGER